MEDAKKEPKQKTSISIPIKAKYCIRNQIIGRSCLLIHLFIYFVYSKFSEISFVAWTAVLFCSFKSKISFQKN